MQWASPCEALALVQWHLRSPSTMTFSDCDKKKYLTKSLTSELIYLVPSSECAASQYDGYPPIYLKVRSIPTLNIVINVMQL